MTNGRSSVSRYTLKALPALLLYLAFGFAVSQTVVSSALEELTRFYGAAVKLIANAVSGINNVQAAQIPQSDRNEVRNELRAIVRDLQAPLESGARSSIYRNMWTRFERARSTGNVGRWPGSVSWRASKRYRKWCRPLWRSSKAAGGST